ncbi:MAG: hypothetical protein DRP73_01350 [Candidatus Omnitrophota bacterium]|nr:MAG: hypothetical protein DRP73_01350 [Candidatus Omnitrophota bacterium]
MGRLYKFIDEFGFYIFILFSTFVISILGSFIPFKVDLKPYYTRLVMLEQILEDKVAHFPSPDLISRPVWYLFAFIFVIIFLSAVVIFLYLIFNFLSRKRVMAGSNFRPCPLWNMKDFFKIFIWILFWIEVISVFQDFMGMVFVYNFRTYLINSLCGSLMVDLLTIFLLIYWLRRHYHQKITAVGISLSSTVQDFKRAVFYYLGFLPVLFLLIYAGIFIAHRIQKPSPPQPLFYFLLFENDRLILTLVIIFVVIIGPIAEELFFRGLFYNALKKSIGVSQAMLVSSILFAVLHMNIFGFLPIFGLALLFVFMYERTASLKVPIFLHMLHNGFLVAMIVFVRIFIQS